MSHTTIRASSILLAVVVFGASSIATDVDAPALRRAAVFDTAMSARFAAPQQSINWSGYAITGGPYTSVTGHWTVPRVSPTFRLRASAVWVGIDGVLEDNLIQTGTEQDSFNGKSDYYAWWEILPAPAVPITAFTVRPGDRMTATIRRVKKGTWRITITDARSGSFTITRTYRGAGTSAEWIEEAPFLGRRLAPLASHGVVTFDHGSVNGVNPKLKAGQAIAMVQDGVTVAIPSSPDQDRDGFRIAQGAVAPEPPPS